MMFLDNCMINATNSDRAFFKRENLNHTGFDDAKKSLLDNDCHHKKGGECECMNTWY